MPLPNNRRDRMNARRAICTNSGKISYAEASKAFDSKGCQLIVIAKTYRFAQHMYRSMAPHQRVACRPVA